MSDLYLKFAKRIDRRSPRNEGDPERPITRENLLSRNGICKRPPGTERAHTNQFTDKATWLYRYHTFETGIISPKTIFYTIDGKIWSLDDQAETVTERQDLFNENAYPKAWLYKTGTQNMLYFVDEKDLYKYDGNNDYSFEKITITDTNGNSIYPIDVIEHKDRLILISEAYVYISANLQPEVFNDATDSIQLIVGSGKGKNKSLGKIDDKLYILNTEGIFGISGDVISALASTFEVILIDSKKCIARRTVITVEKAIVFLADDYNIYSFDGARSTKLSHDEKIEDFINTYPAMLKKAVATYEDNYYKLSIVEKAQVNNMLEIWWDAFENKIDFIKGRYVAYYMQSDPEIEQIYKQFCHSATKFILWADRGYCFDNTAIVSRLLTRDITIKKGINVRFLAFYPEFKPIGDRNILFRYFLDGRLSDLDDKAKWTQNLQGETKELGSIKIRNQEQVMYRVRPKIGYSKGQSIAFYINDDTFELSFSLLGIGIDYIAKYKKKGRKVGQ